MDFWEQAATTVWMALGASLVGLAVSAMRRGAALLMAQEARIRNASLRDALQYATAEAEQAAATIVTGLNQTAVNQLKAQGKWDATAAAATKKQALQLLDRTVSADAKAVLKRAGTDLDAYLSSLIESKVATAANHVTARGGGAKAV